MSRAALKAGIAALRTELAPPPCTVVIVPHDSPRAPWGWFASVPLAGVWQAVSIQGSPEHAAECIRVLRPRCPFVALLSCAGPVGEVLA